MNWKTETSYSLSYTQQEQKDGPQCQTFIL